MTTINAITFGGGYNIPAWIAQRQGFFAKHGVAVNVTYTPNSVYLMTSLIEGKFDMALTSIDNLIAYQEGQGEAPVKAPVDLVAFMGMDNAFLYLITAPQIKTFADLRGKELSVDAMSHRLRVRAARNGQPQRNQGVRNHLRARRRQPQPLPRPARRQARGHAAADAVRNAGDGARATTSSRRAWISSAITWAAARSRSARG